MADDRKMSVAPSEIPLGMDQSPLPVREQDATVLNPDTGEIIPPRKPRLDVTVAPEKFTSVFDFDILPAWIQEGLFALGAGTRPDGYRRDMPQVRILDDIAVWNGITGVLLHDLVFWIATERPVRWDEVRRGSVNPGASIADENDLGAFIEHQVNVVKDPLYSRFFKFRGTTPQKDVPRWSSLVGYLDVGEDHPYHPKNSILVRKKVK